MSISKNCKSITLRTGHFPTTDEQYKKSQDHQILCQTFTSLFRIDFFSANQKFIDHV